MADLTALFNNHGQSIWLDNLSRAQLNDGSLAGRIAQGVRGLTSNPTIFAKAIQGSDDYDEQFNGLIASGVTPVDAYWHMVIDDIQDACDAFAPLHESSDAIDGYVSVEVAPDLSRDTSGTLAAAQDLHNRVDRRNVMIKIPATVEGLPAIQSMIAEGRSVNVTLIFSPERHQQVMEAYISGLEQLAADPAADLSRVASVASFFISRVDSEVDQRLGSPDHDLCGTAAIAQGRLAYNNFIEMFSGPRWEALAARGARVQRPLWASTGTKNPAYSDVLYVDELIGPDTVNTVPEVTLDAYLNHGVVNRTVDTDHEATVRTLSALSQAGIDLGDVSEQLEREGLASFEASFDEVIDALRAKAS
ncbi:MAG: transaldolase [Ilumatobacteraceae bacterium]